MRQFLGTLLIGLTLISSGGLVRAGSLEDGNAAYQRGDFATALQLFQPLAEQGNATAQTDLGAMYEFGQSLPQDLAQAMRWYRKAADQGFAIAQFNVANMYANGRGVSQNYTEALKWYLKAADQGLAIAQSKLGLMYQFGYGVPQNHAEALTWFRKSADQGSSDGQTNLGFMYANGLGVQRDYAEAAKWYRKSADQGNTNAKANLADINGRLAAKGRPQAEKDQFDARVRARAAKCTTGNKEMCIMYAQQKEIELRAFCQSKYAPAAYNIWGYKAIGWPAEMTAEHISLPVDLLIPLVRAGYSGNWKSAQDFNNEAQRRCLNGDFF
jgi:TPR repeat protein